MRVSMKNRKEGLPQTKNIVFALERPKAAHSVWECEARVPVGVHAPHGRPISVMIPIIEAVAVPTSGWCSQAVRTAEDSTCAGSVSGKRKAVPRARKIATAVADGPLSTIRRLPRLSEMTPTTEVEVVSIVGTWTVNIQQMSLNNIRTARLLG